VPFPSTPPLLWVSSPPPTTISRKSAQWLRLAHIARGQVEGEEKQEVLLEGGVLVHGLALCLVRWPSIFLLSISPANLRLHRPSQPWMVFSLLRMRKLSLQKAKKPA
jgi:hypothetical protein